MRALLTPAQSAISLTLAAAKPLRENRSIVAPRMRSRASSLLSTLNTSTPVSTNRLVKYIVPY